MVGHCLRKCCFAAFYFLLDPGTGRWTGSWMQSATPQLKSPTLSTAKLKLLMLTLCTSVWTQARTSTREKYEHNPRGFLWFFFGRLKDGDEAGCLKNYKKPTQTIPRHCEKTQVCTCFYFGYKEGDSRQKLSKLCWEPKARDEKKTTVSELFTWGSTEHDGFPFVSKAEPKQISN